MKLMIAFEVKEQDTGTREPILSKEIDIFHFDLKKNRQSEIGYSRNFYLKLQQLAFLIR